MNFHYQLDIDTDVDSYQGEIPNYKNADISPVVGAFAIATKGHFYELNPAI